MKNRFLRVLKIYLALLILFVSYYLLNKYIGLSIPCLFHEITGLDCPGCGITRCLFAIVKLDIKSAFEANPLVFIYLPFIVMYFLYQSYLYIYDKKDKILVKIPNYVMHIILVITILYGIIRNINFQ